MKIKIEGKVIELKTGDTVHGFSSDVPGFWEIESLRPFRVIANQQGKKWNIDVSAKEFASQKLGER